MPARQIAPGVFAVGVQDWNRTLFDALIPLPRGTSYNCYLVRGAQKTALIDAVDPGKWEELRSNLQRLDAVEVDFIIANHAEQDHSGALPELLARFPRAKIVANLKCREMLRQLLHLPLEAFQLCENEEVLDLGGKTLRFLTAPWVHWPETMFTYLIEDQILFSCDFFGSHLAGAALYAREAVDVISEAKRYYAQIMMPYANWVKKNLELAESLPLSAVAPSHGPIWDPPAPILQAYRQWVLAPPKNEVLLLVVSMHGSTAKLADHLSDELMQRGVGVRMYDLVSADLGEIAMAAVDAATICFASPVVHGGPHPLMAHAANVMACLRPKARSAAIIGSFGWGNRLPQGLHALLEGLDLNYFEPVICQGLPTDGDLTAIGELAGGIASRHQAAGCAG